jgi:hypothetical protein
MRTIWLLPALLICACGDQDGHAGNGADSANAPVQTATLTGLYESGGADRRSRMCAIERDGTVRFGLVVWSAADQGCSGAGTATRSGDRLRLVLAGSESCTIEARIEGRRLVFPPTQPPGCAYYCSPGARFAGAALDKIGGTEADAMRAEDLVGDRLCAG